MRQRVALRELGPWYAFAVCLIKPLLLLFTRRRWTGLEHVPRQGGVVLAANHISHVDPLVLCDYVLYGVGRPARFMAKSTLFAGRGLVGTVMRGARQIPVHRHTSDASAALRDAVAALRAGELIVIYPEGTVSRDPDKWPMAARTGVARLALLSGAPVVPVGQWGAQSLLDSYRGGRLRLLPPQRVAVAAGPPVDLTAWAGRELTAEVLRGATEAVMRDITGLVEGLRGQSAPEQVHVWQRTVDEKRTA